MTRLDKHDVTALSPLLRSATDLLREGGEPGESWRREVLSAVADMRDSRSRDSGRRWAMRPLTAIVAGITCAVLGGAAALALRPPAPRPAVATSSGTYESVVRFALDAPTATTVHIVGDFNGWNPTALPLRRSDDGRTWEVEVPLSPGRYSYAFLVDGSLARDPRAPRAVDDDFGTPNSVVLVTGS